MRRMFCRIFLGSRLPVWMLSIFGRVLFMRIERLAWVGADEWVQVGVGAGDGQERTEDLNLTVY